MAELIWRRIVLGELTLKDVYDDRRMRRYLSVLIERIEKDTSDYGLIVFKFLYSQGQAVEKKSDVKNEWTVVIHNDLLEEVLNS